MEPAKKIELEQRVKQYFLEFLQTFRVTSDGVRADSVYYVEQAKQMVREGKCTLYVSLSDLEQLDPESVGFIPADLRNVISSKYLLVRDAINSTVPELLSKFEEPDLEELVRVARESNELKFTVAFSGLGMFSGIRQLRTDRRGALTSICGTVMRTSEVKPELLVGTFQCNECNREITGIEQQFKVTEPAMCPGKPGRSCGNRSNFTLLGENRTTVWGDWQRIRLQENENEVPAGSMPRCIDVIVRDECKERCKAGDKVCITGTLIVVPDVPTMMHPGELKQQVRRSLNTRTDAGYEGIKGLRGLGNKDLTYKLAFYGIYVEEDSDWSNRHSGSENIRSVGQPELKQDMKERFREVALKKGPSGKRSCLDEVARCIAPSIHGHLEVKKGILLMLIGGIPKKTDEGIKLRGDVNVCLLGDPATAKSALLKWTSTFLPRAVFTSGKSSSAAGLTASVTRDADLDGEKVIQPGALMLADNGVCCIDEFETMDQTDQTAIHEAMEQQTITLSKAGIQATLNARTSILASCLPRNTYYEPTLPLHKNCELSPPIMSRFDLMFVMQDVKDETNDDNVAKHILALHRGVKEDIAPSLDQVQLQQYIKLARAHFPTLIPEARDKLVRCYKKLREDRSYVRGSSGVTVRQLESLIRLSEAIARVHLDEKVTVEYVNQAFELQMMTLQRPEQENVELNPEAPEDIAPAGDDGDAVGGAVGDVPRGRRMRITYAEYQRIGQMLANHLAVQEDAGVEVREEDLIAWYMEQEEENIQTEAQLFEQQHLVQLIVTRLIDKDRVIVVYRPSEDPMRPEGRVLVRHPNFPVGEPIGRPRGQ